MLVVKLPMKKLTTVTVATITKNKDFKTKIPK